MLTKNALLLLATLSLLNAKEYTLSNLCKKGIENNPRIQSFTYKSFASTSAYDKNVDRYKPQINISGQYGNQDYTLGDSISETAYNGINYNYKLSLTQPIYRAKLIHSITDAQERETLAKIQEEDEKAKLITKILQISIDLTRQKETIDILKKKVSLLEKAYENIKKKYNIKLASSADRFQSLAMLQQAKSSRIKVEQNYQYNLYNLRLLTKYDHVEKYITPLKFNISQVVKAYKHAKLGSIRSSISNNTSVRIDKQLANIAKVQIDLRQSERSPQINAELSYGDSGGATDIVTRQNEYRAMVTLSFPIFQGGYVNDNVKESKYLYHAAQEDYENTRLNIKISMEKALQNIKGGLESINADNSAVDASKKYFDGMLKSYRSGMSSLTDAYLAEAEYRENQLRLIASKANIFSSLIDLYYYGGKADFQHVKEFQKKFFH